MDRYALELAGALWVVAKWAWRQEIFYLGQSPSIIGQRCSESWMDNREFSQIRGYLSKTQRQLAQLLGVSPKAVQSFEQGWRNIPTHVERQLLLLLSLKRSTNGINRPCWVVRDCPIETRGDCPAWEFGAGNLCWLINGTICHGEVQATWQQKVQICRQCDVLRSILLPTRD